MDILTTRQQEIVSILNEKEQLSVNDLAEHFSVTPATIRRELTLLAASGKRLIIPMRDRCESLNAAAAAAVVLWEMAR